MNKQLEKQIEKYLPKDIFDNPGFKKFIQIVNESYVAFERDINLMNNAFDLTEKEFKEINESLEKEYELKRLSIGKLYETIRNFGDNDFQANQSDEDDLLVVANYLHKQIEDRKQFENDLSRSVQLFKTLLANLQAGILVEDENRIIMFTNNLFCDAFSIPFSPDQMVGIDCSNSAEQSKHLFKYPEQFGPRIDEILSKREVVTSELLETVNNRILKRDYIPIFINNEYKGHLWKYSDVTERIKIQNQIKESETRNRLIMDAALNAIIIVNSKGHITFWNHQSENIFGWQQDEVLGKQISEVIIPQQYVEGHHKGMDLFMRTGKGPALNKQIELPALHKLGYEFPVEISITPIELNNEVFFCSFIQDISVRKAAERKIKLQEEKFRNIIANINLGLVEVDNDDIIQYANQSFAEISGYEINEIIGKSAIELFALGENFEIVKSQQGLRQQGISDVYQILVRNKKGEMRWWAISGAPNYDDKGNLIGSIGIHLDITEQKKLEIELEQEKNNALAASKAKEMFLANMSHEIRTPLNAIIGFLRELSKQELADDQKKHIENSSIASQHLLSIINNVLDISKIEAGEMSIENENFVFHDLIDNVVTVLKERADQKGIVLNAAIDSKIAKILKGDTLRIEQILFNLIGNSLKFTHQGSVTIDCKLTDDFEDTQKVCIAIVDTGIGMDQSYVETIFNKFSQENSSVTRKFGGTGLGMAITKQLVDLMQGHIEVFSEKGKGTTISVCITFDKGKLEHEEEDTKHIDISLDKINILLVEDNIFNRMVAQNTLSCLNCEVTEATNGLEAIEILRSQKFDIILMDIQMPEMDGIEATKVVRNELKISTPIIALTANAFKSEIEHSKSVGMDDYVSKPFDEKTLIETITKHFVLSKPIKNINTEHKIVEGQLYNLDTLLSISRGNTEFVKKMLSIFVEQTKTTLDQIDEAFQSDDFIEVSRLIHKIKPSIESVGVISILEEVKTLEKLGKESLDKEEMVALYNLIKNNLKQVILEIEKNEI